MTGGWRLDRAVGPAADFHGRALPSGTERTVAVLTVDRPALVLGSTQRDEVVDRAALAAAGVDLVRRRSGGGAVLVEPARTVWIDVDVPVGDPLWSADVGRSFGWLGRTWAAALADLGLRAEVHDGGLCTTPWSRLICFAGLGPGEVMVGEAKAVGLAQRRIPRQVDRRLEAGAGGRRPGGRRRGRAGPGGPGRRRVPRPPSVTTRRNKPF